MCAQGEQVTWTKLSAIQANCGIEATLDACMLRLSEVVAAQKQVQGLYRVAKSGRNGANGVSNGMRQRIPSWINLASMGGAHLIYPSLIYLLLALLHPVSLL